MTALEIVLLISLVVSISINALLVWLIANRPAPDPDIYAPPDSGRRAIEEEAMRRAGNWPSPDDR